LRRWRSFEVKGFAPQLRVAIAKEAQKVEVLGPRELFCLDNSLGETVKRSNGTMPSIARKGSDCDALASMVAWPTLAYKRTLSLMA
jgi:hypothetical protein